MGGVFVVVAGVWVICQVTGGDLLGRLKITQLVLGAK